MTTEIVTLEVRVLPVTELTPAEYNPRKLLKPTDKSYRKLRASLEEFGLVEPLVWNEVTGRVVGGHARLAILKELGVATVPVSVVRLTEAKEKALNVVLNNQEAQGRYDTGRLALLLEELRDLRVIDATGFDASAIAALKLQPIEAAPVEPPADRMEVRLVADSATFAVLRPRLDELVRAFDIEVHVKSGA